MATFADNFTRLREEFDHARQDRKRLLRDLQAEVRDHAAQTGSRLTEQAMNRLADFTEMMGSLRAQVQGQAAQTRGQLAELAADLRQGGRVFRGSTKPCRSR